MFPLISFTKFIFVLVILTNTAHIILSLLNRKRISLVDSSFDKIVNSFIVMFFQSLVFLLLYDYNFKINESTNFNMAYLLISNGLLFVHTLLDINNPESKIANTFIFIIVNTIIILSLYYML